MSPVNPLSKWRERNPRASRVRWQGLRARKGKAGRARARNRALTTDRREKQREHARRAGVAWLLPRADQRRLGLGRPRSVLQHTRPNAAPRQLSRTARRALARLEGRAWHAVSLQRPTRRERRDLIRLQRG